MARARKADLAARLADTEYSVRRGTARRSYWFNWYMRQRLSDLEGYALRRGLPVTREDN
jgi:hypothetical protein